MQPYHHQQQQHFSIVQDYCIPPTVRKMFVGRGQRVNENAFIQALMLLVFLSCAPCQAMKKVMIFQSDASTTFSRFTDTIPRPPPHDESSIPLLDYYGTSHATLSFPIRYMILMEPNRTDHCVVITWDKHFPSDLIHKWMREREHTSMDHQPFRMNSRTHTP
jgi:hypothetical protein